MKSQVDGVAGWWPYEWLYVLAVVTAFCAGVWLTLMLTPGPEPGAVSASPAEPVTPPKRVQLYTHVIRRAESGVWNDHRLYERREFNGREGIPEWGIQPGDGTWEGQYVAYRSREEPYVIPTVANAASGDADRDFTLIP